MGVGASGVIMFSMLIDEAGGAQEEIVMASVVTAIFKMTVALQNLFVIATCDQRPGLSVNISSDHPVGFYKFPQIRFIACDGYPAAQYKWNGSFCQHPFTVIFPGDMGVCAG